MAQVEGSTDPANPAFWFIMSMALIAGFLCAYPMNWWLVTRHLKHGMMTVRHESAGEHDGHDMASMEDHSHPAGHGEHSEHAEGGAHAHHDMKQGPPPGVIFGAGALSVLILAGAVTIVVMLVPPAG